MRVMDKAVLTFLNGFLIRHDAIEDPLLQYETRSQLIFAGILIALFFVARHERRADARRAAVAAAVSSALALTIGLLISNVVERPRPFIADPTGVHLFAKHAADSGFPSDHATVAFAIATAIFLRDRRWGGVVCALALLVAIGRVAIGVHYPTDVLAGALLGCASALTIWWKPIRRWTDRLADRLGGIIDIWLGQVGLANSARNR